MLDSVRIRLTIWYVGVLAFVLIAFALAAYFFLARAISQRTDDALAEVASAFAATVNAEGRDEEEENPKDATIAETLQDFRFKDYRFVIYDETRRIIASSKSIADSSETPPTSSIISSPKIETLFDNTARLDRAFETLKVGKTQFRAVANVMRLDKRTYIIVVARSLYDQTELLEQSRRALFIAVPTALLIASLGGYFLARKSLAPVVAMSNQAAQISAANLHERFPIANARDELGRLALVFNDLLARLDQSFEQQRRFMADASHELRTPVAIMRGEAEVALSKTDRTFEDYRQSLAVVHDEGQRLTRIVEDLFTLARADAGQHPLVNTDFYLDELIEECTRAMRTLATQRGLSLNCEAALESPMRGDEALLRRMLLNLLDNAIKHTPAGGVVRLALARRGESYTITVADSGTGIPIAAQPHIFERFYRADAARSRAENAGAGLGLSIARWAAEAHGGEIVLERSSQAGSTFVITLPVPDNVNSE